MITWWIAQIALLGSLLALAAFGAEAALRIARRQTRWVWIGAMLLTVALAISAPQRARLSNATARVWSTKGATSDAIVVVEQHNLLASLNDAWNAAQIELTQQMQRVWSAWHAVAPEQIERWLMIGWGALSIALLVAFASVQLRYRRQRAQWPNGVVHGTSVRIATDVGPAVVGVTNAEIVIPQWLLTRDSVEQQLVLSHELEHVRARDPLLLSLAQLIVILLPWHPAVWWMASRLRLAVELDCDQRVLQRGASARDYGSLLIDLTDQRLGFPAALPAFSCRPSHLERRLVAMTPKPMRYPLIRVLCTGAIASLALLAACEATLPTSQDVDRMTASTATTAAARVSMIDTTNVSYFINGVAATKAAAEKLNAEQIAEVNVTKSSATDGGTVYIVTRDAEGVANAAGSSKTATRVTVTTPTEEVVTSTTGRNTAARRPQTNGLSVIEELSTPPVPPQAPTRSGFTGLMIVDGAITDPAIANSIAPDQIVSVDITKGPAARAQYSDPRAANGVIKITTKKGATKL
jgi:beta-lactamase regulating signal transducer with metallopeptidase domain